MFRTIGGRSATSRNVFAPKTAMAGRENWRMNTRFLATLRTVAEAGSLAAAARQLNLAVASVSEQIRTLEKDLDAPLLARHGRGVALRHVAQVGQPSGLLRVGAIPSAAQTPLLAMHRALRDCYAAILNGEP